MNIESTKLELMHLLLQTQKEVVLTKIKAIFEQESNAFYFNDISEVHQRAKASLEAIENGKTRPINEFKSEVDHWKKGRKAI
ncbi:hypothetical protein NBT05_07780 [Aquimarina sp. ERC-38]|uniref:hypothetical protein n=1 Tax=Aquimarina sp. ERC-38 TaxID=2949996 RepID=UPI002246A9B5|nr:hypothetical protein [Aquimarina sp. ERC-38]UZO82364.1 hypothetical protein NBT05_07780 [Aquimarina sp. ERC-38]